MDSVRQMEPSGSNGWLGAGARLLATLFFLVLIVAVNRCIAPGRQATPPTGTGLPSPAAAARLRVEVRPAGAAVRVDGLRSGNTPVTLELPPGRHTVRVELECYLPLEQVAILTAGEELALEGDLLPLASSAIPGPTATVPLPQEELPLPDLTFHHVRIELETGGNCDYPSTHLGLAVMVQNAGQADAGPFVVEANGVQREVSGGLAAGQKVRLWFEGYQYSEENRVVVDATFQVRESDETNNTFSQKVPIPTLPPTCTPVPVTPPTPTATPQPQTVTVCRSRLTFRLEVPDRAVVAEPYSLLLSGL